MSFSRRNMNDAELKRRSAGKIGHAPTINNRVVLAKCALLLHRVLNAAFRRMVNNSNVRMSQTSSPLGKSLVAAEIKCGEENKGCGNAGQTPAARAPGPFPSI